MNSLSFDVDNDITPANRSNRCQWLWKCFKKMKSFQCCVSLGIIILVFSVAIVLSQQIYFDLNDFSEGESLNCGENQNCGEIKLVIDTDAGTDDAIALMYLLRAERQSEGNADKSLKIMAITCGIGNTILKNVAMNVLRVLQAVGRLDIPVYKGTNKSLVFTHPPDIFFGYDGMGDVPNLDPPSLDLIKPEHAANALVKIVNDNPGEITILALGPLTNIALACRLDEDFLKKVKRLYILGGATQGNGNMVPGVEFNFWYDPESVHIVMNETEVDRTVITLVPWEPVTKSAPKHKWRKEVLGALDSPEVKFINAIEHIDQMSDDDDWLMADALAGVVTFMDEVIVRTEVHGIITSLSGMLRGAIGVDYSNINQYNNMIEIIYDVDKNAYLETLINHFK